MRSLSKNRQLVWVASPIGREPERDADGFATGDYTETYSAPKRLLVNVSANRGAASEQPFGAELDYTKTMASAGDMGLREGDLVWQDTVPPDGENDGATADYAVVAVARSLNGTLVAMRAVTKDGT